MIPNSNDDGKYTYDRVENYRFGSSTLDEHFRDLYWDDVYTVKNYIPRIQKVTNTNTGESFEKEFYFQIVEGDDAVETVLSDAMRVYPSVANDVLTIEVPAVGGEYAIYSISGAQVSKGELAQYKTDINVSSLAAGTYILRYVHNSGVGVKTFVKK